MSPTRASSVPPPGSPHGVTASDEVVVTTRRLWVGVLLAPLAWVVAELVGYYLASRSCEPIPRGVPLGGTAFPEVVQVVLAVALAAVAAAGLWTAVESWRAVRSPRERVARPRNEPGLPALGRARFMAYGGTIGSALFLLGILFFALPPLLVNACGHAH